MTTQFRLTPEAIRENVLDLIEHGLDPVDFVRNVEHELGWECSECGWRIYKPKHTDCLSCGAEEKVKPLWICSSYGWKETILVMGRCRECGGLIKEFWLRKALTPPRCPAENPHTRSAIQ